MGSNILETYYYSSRGTVDSVRIGSFPQVIKNYADSRGRDTLVVDQLGHQTRYIYDATMGNLKQTIRDGGQTATRVFDALGRDTLAISPTADTTRVVYDLMNRVSAVYDPVNPNPTRTHYGPIYADSVTDPKGETYRFVHDALGWVTQRFGPASSTLADQYGFDIAGNVVRATNRNGQVIDYTLDLLGRVTKVTAPDDTVEFGFDPSGQDRFVWGKNAWGTDTIFLTSPGLVDSTKTDRGAATYGIGYAYGHWSGQPTEIHDGYNGRTIKMQYNDQGQLDTLIVRDRKTYVDTRNADLQTLTRVYPAVFNHSLEYTSDHRRADIRWGNLVTRGLGFDSAGRVTTIDPETSQSMKFKYDRLSRLAKRDIFSDQQCSWIWPWGRFCTGGNLVGADTFTYDAVGNRTDGGAVIDPGSRLSEIAVHSDTLRYTYDAAGNVTRREEVIAGVVQDLYWSSLGQLDSVVITTGAGSEKVHYRYDAFGRRIRKDNGTSTIDYVWAGDHVLFDIRDTVVTEYSYLPGMDRLHAQYREGVFRYYLTDHLGSVALMTDSTGTEETSYRYDPWGFTEAASEETENRFRFAGREFDPETGLYYLRARYYDPVCGRFISEDPIGLAAGINPYAYANNNPLSLRDPSGLDEEEGDPPPDCTDPASPGGREILPGEMCIVTDLENAGRHGFGTIGFRGGSPRVWSSGGLRHGGGSRGRGRNGVVCTEAGCGAEITEVDLIGIEAELNCSAAFLVAYANAGADVLGLKAAVATIRVSVGVVDSGLRWAWRGVVQGTNVGAPMGVAGAAATGQLAGKDPRYAAAHGFLGYAGTVVPGVSSYLAYRAFEDACFNPGN